MTDSSLRSRNTPGERLSPDGVTSPVRRHLKPFPGRFPCTGWCGDSPLSLDVNGNSRLQPAPTFCMCVADVGNSVGEGNVVGVTSLCSHDTGRQIKGS